MEDALADEGSLSSSLREEARCAQCKARNLEEEIGLLRKELAVRRECSNEEADRYFERNQALCNTLAASEDCVSQLKGQVDFLNTELIEKEKEIEDNAARFRTEVLDQRAFFEERLKTQCELYSTALNQQERYLKFLTNEIIALKQELADKSSLLQAKNETGVVIPPVNSASELVV